MDIIDQMGPDTKIYFWYILNAVRRPGHETEPQMAFDVAPTGKTGDGAQYLNQVIPETIRRLTVSDIDEYKIHRSLRKEAGYDFASALDFFRQKYPPPKIVSNADDPKLRLDGAGGYAGDDGESPGTGLESLPAVIMSAAPLPGDGNDGGANP